MSDLGVDAVDSSSSGISGSLAAWNDPPQSSIDAWTAAMAVASSNRSAAEQRQSNGVNGTAVDKTEAQDQTSSGSWFNRGLGVLQAGGVASVAGSGKFANGAIRGAVADLFSPQAGDEGGSLQGLVDYCKDPNQCTQQEIESGAEGGIKDPTSPWLEIAVFGRTLYSALASFFRPNTYGLPPEGVNPPNEHGPFTIAPNSRSAPSQAGQSLWDANGGEWRWQPEDDFHNPHWNYNPWNHPFDEWQNIPIDKLPPRKPL